MSRKNLTSAIIKAASCATAFVSLSLAFPNVVAYQDVTAFAGKKPGNERWLASIITSSNGLGYDLIASKGAYPVILDENGSRLTGLDISATSRLKGYAFAPSPEIAQAVSNPTAVRAAKGDLPVEEISRRRQAIFAGVMFDKATIFSAPNQKLWPRVALVEPVKQIAAPKVPEKQDRPRRKVVVAKKDTAPLDLIPEAAIAAIETEARAQVSAEQTKIVAAAIPGLAETQIGYAATIGDDPRAVFEAVLSSHGNTDIAGAGDSAQQTAATAPNPVLKPEVDQALEPQKKQKRKLHFWAGFRLPGSVYRKNQQRCLAAAIYFEARGEIERGQAAVAQVVLNRVKAPAYPNTICGVVYQNKHLRNRCQFSFACDGVYDRVNDKKSWQRAVEIARDVSKGKTYLEDVADSTHYHATYVNPKWGRSMKVLTKIGVHIFYRTKNGGWS